MKTSVWPSRRIILDGGLNLSDKEWKISDSQTAKVLNMWHYNGELGKRWGQEYLNHVGSSPVLNAYKYLFNDKIILHSGDKLIEIEKE